MTGPDHFRPTLGVNVILLRDGREIHLDDIETAAQGQAILDEIDEAIDGIEIQVEGRRAEVDPFWLQRASTALKRKRRQRPRLQQRIGELRRAEKAAGTRDALGQVTSKVDAKRQAFIHAAYEMLGHETCVEVWAKAQEKQPGLFSDGVIEGAA